MLNLLADLSLYHTRLLKLNFINAISENVYLMKGVISGLGQKSTSSEKNELQTQSYCYLVIDISCKRHTKHKYFTQKITEVI